MASLSPEQAVRFCQDMPVGLALVRKTGEIDFVNNYFCRILDMPEGAACSIRIEDVIANDRYHEFKVVCKGIESGDYSSQTFTSIIKRSGDRPEKRRLSYCSITLWRHPVSGDFEHFVGFFVPHNDIDNKPRWSDFITVSNYIRDNYKWIVAMVITLSVLLSGNWNAISELRKQADNVEQVVSQDGPTVKSPSGE